MKASGLRLGLFESAEYGEACDLVVFLDGFTEAVDPGNEDSGPDRLEKIVAANAEETADRVVNSICFLSCFF